MSDLPMLSAMLSRLFESSQSVYLLAVYVSYSRDYLTSVHVLLIDH